VTRASRLIGNLGAEAGPEWRHHAGLPSVATARHLWSLLFPHPIEWIAPDDGGATSGAGSDPFGAFPERAGERAGKRAAFPWLEAGEGVTAWLATEESEALCSERGLPITGVAAPVVAHVHDKAFALREATRLGYVPRELESLVQIFEPDALRDPNAFVAQIRETLATWPDWTGGRFTLKPRSGSSGRGRVAGNASPDSPDPLRNLPGACERLARCGGAVLEPWLERACDLSTLVHIARPEAGAAEAGGRAAGEILLLGSLEQWMTPSGRCLGHFGEVDSRGRVFSGHTADESIREAAAALAGAAREAGYFGPAGLDSFVYRRPGDGVGDAASDGAGDEAGDEAKEAREVLRPVVELNARFTLGVVAIGLVRRALPGLRRELGLEPGERRAFLVALDLPGSGVESGAKDAASWDALCEARSPDVYRVPLWNDGVATRPALLFGRDLDELRALL